MRRRIALVLVRGPGGRAARARPDLPARWQYAGRAEELTAPGSYAATHVAGPARRARPATATTCCAPSPTCAATAARSSRSGAGERGTLQCPYHAWTYGLDGCLRAAPRTRDDPDFAPDGLGLVPMALGTWGPFVFVNPDAGRRRRSPTALGDLPDVVAAHGLDVDALRFHHRVEYEIRANWKIALENYLECYHCQLNHPGLVSVIDDRRLTLEAAGLRASQFNPAHPDFDVRPAAIPRGPVPPALPGAQGQRPARHARTCRSARSGRSPPTAAAATWTTSSRRTRPRPGSRSSSPSTTRSGAEDTALVEGAQRGAGSGLVPEGRLLAHDEQLIAHFQAYVRGR